MGDESIPYNISRYIVLNAIVEYIYSNKDADPELSNFIKDGSGGQSGGDGENTKIVTKGAPSTDDTTLIPVLPKIEADDVFLQSFIKEQVSSSNLENVISRYNDPEHLIPFSSQFSEKNGQYLNLVKILRLILTIRDRDISKSTKEFAYKFIKSLLDKIYDSPTNILSSLNKIKAPYELKKKYIDAIILLTKRFVIYHADFNKSTDTLFDKIYEFMIKIGKMQDIFYRFEDDKIHDDKDFMNKLEQSMTNPLLTIPYKNKDEIKNIEKTISSSNVDEMKIINFLNEYSEKLGTTGGAVCEICKLIEVFKLILEQDKYKGEIDDNMKKIYGYVFIILDTVYDDKFIKKSDKKTIEDILLLTQYYVKYYAYYIKEPNILFDRIYNFIKKIDKKTLSENIKQLIDKDSNFMQNLQTYINDPDFIIPIHSLIKNARLEKKTGIYHRQNVISYHITALKNLHTEDNIEEFLKNSVESFEKSQESVLNRINIKDHDLYILIDIFHNTLNTKNQRYEKEINDATKIDINIAKSLGTLLNAVYSTKFIDKFLQEYDKKSTDDYINKIKDLTDKFNKYYDSHKEEFSNDIPLIILVKIVNNNSDDDIKSLIEDYNKQFYSKLLIDTSTTSPDFNKHNHKIIQTFFYILDQDKYKKNKIQSSMKKYYHYTGIILDTIYRNESHNKFIEKVLLTINSDIESFNPISYIKKIILLTEQYVKYYITYNKPTDNIPITDKDTDKDTDNLFDKIQKFINRIENTPLIESIEYESLEKFMENLQNLISKPFLTIPTLIKHMKGERLSHKLIIHLEDALETLYKRYGISDFLKKLVKSAEEQEEKDFIKCELCILINIFYTILNYPKYNSVNSSNTDDDTKIRNIICRSVGTLLHAVYTENFINNYPKKYQPLDTNSYSNLYIDKILYLSEKYRLFCKNGTDVQNDTLLQRINRFEDNFQKAKKPSTPRIGRDVASKVASMSETAANATDRIGRDVASKVASMSETATRAIKKINFPTVSYMNSKRGQEELSETGTQTNLGRSVAFEDEPINYIINKLLEYNQTEQIKNIEKIKKYLSFIYTGTEDTDETITTHFQQEYINNKKISPTQQVSAESRGIIERYIKIFGQAINDQ